jgi:xanthine/CO dehydrogenase XdhC/CoxF family maturation factor
MKHWHETSRIVERIVTLAASGRHAALGTVVRIVGSAYRRPGAKLLVEADGPTLGGVSGGCLEADVREVALQVLREGLPRLRHYDTGADEHTVWGLGLGCNGAVDVFVQPVTTPEALPAVRRLRELLAGEEGFAVSTIVEGPTAVGRMVISTRDGSHGATGDPSLDRGITTAAREALTRDGSAIRVIGSAQVFTEVHRPPPWLLVCGAGDDALPLVRFAASVGFRVAVVDHRPAYVTTERFPDASRLLVARAGDAGNGLPEAAHTLAVVMNHALAHDREWMRRLLADGVRYVGALGPRERTERILEELAPADADRVYGPVGLDLGADGPEQVALAVVAELMGVLAGREPGHLRHRRGAIHAG